MNNKLPTVVIGDLVGSRAVRGRKSAARRIERTLAEVTAELTETEGVDLFAALPAFVKGIDEISAVFWRPAKSYAWCRMINQRIAPMVFRFAIARGAIDIGLDAAKVSRMDGPAFHKAAGGIEQARKRDQLFSISCGFPGSPDELLTVLANTVQSLFSKLSEHQRSVVSLYEIHGNQSQVAKVLGITQQAVSDALRAAQFRLLDSANNAIDNFLSSIEIDNIR